MKTKKIFLGICTLALLIASSCTKESDIELIQHNEMLFNESFTGNTDGQELNTPGWTNYSEFGTKKWTEQTYSGGGYAEFSAFGSGQLINVGWLISPAIDMDLHDGEKMNFTSAQNFLRTRENSLELLISTNYDGTNVAAANWVNIPVITAGPETTRFKAISSGVVDLSKYTGKIHFAFKVRGSGTNSNLAGTYQIDDVNVFYASKIK